MLTALDPNTALVLIDLQNGIATLPLFQPANDVFTRSGELIAAFRTKKLPIIFINVNPFKGKFNVTRAESNGLPTTEEGAQQAHEAMLASGFFDIVPQLEVREEDLLITKSSWNAFFDTELHQALKKRGVTGIVLAGIATSIGVEGTARAAHEYGYNLTFPKDAMSDFTEHAHDHSLNVIFPRIGEVDDTAAIINKMEELA